MAEKLYPIMVNLKGKNVVIVGGGKIALRKIKGLDGTGAIIKIVSPEILPEIEQFDFVQCIRRKFMKEDLLGAHFVFATTNSKKVNQEVVRVCNDYQFVNDTSESDHSTFINPAVMEQGKLLITVSTQGASPILAKEIKAELEQRYNQTYIEKLKDYELRRKKHERNN